MAVSSSSWIVVLLILTVAFSQNFYKKVVHNTDPEAKCLDGSPAPLYIHQGSQPNNILLYLRGEGGSCAGNTDEETFRKCKLQSQIYYPDTYEATGLGMFDLSFNNPFAKWTKIGIAYCDGAYFQGYNRNPVEFNGTKLYFRGSAIMRSHFGWIDKTFGFNKANKIVMVGTAAGGVGVTLWIDQLRRHLTNPSKLYGIVDSGIMLDPLSLSKIFDYKMKFDQLNIPNAFLNEQGRAAPSLPGGAIRINSTGMNQSALAVDVMKRFMRLSNAHERLPNTKCLATLTGNDSDWKCVFAPRSLKTLETKILWINSQYDSYIVSDVLRIKCLTRGTSHFSMANCSNVELLQMNLYRQLVNLHVFAELVNAGHSFWSIACSWHIGLANSNLYSSYYPLSEQTAKAVTIKRAVEDYVLSNIKVLRYDYFNWPSNRLCLY